MSAEAHPTPEPTVNAPNSQFPAQAPHSMQEFLSTMAAFLFSIVNTAWGQTSAPAATRAEGVV